MIVSTYNAKNVIGEFLSAIQTPFGLGVIYVTSLGEVDLALANECRVFHSIHDMHNTAAYLGDSVE